MKLVRKLNLEKKEKIVNRGVPLLNSQATIKILPKTSIPSSTSISKVVICLPPNQNIFKKPLRQRFLYQNNFCNYLTNPYI